MDARIPWNKTERGRRYNKLYRERNRERRIENGRRYYQDNRERVLLQGREYYLRNKEKIDARNREYAIRNREKIRAYQKKWREEHREHLKRFQRRYHIENAERINKATLAYKKSTPHRRMAAALRNRLNRFLKKRIGRASTERLLGCSYREFVMHIERQFKGRMSWANYGSHWHLDHIIPCSAFDLSDPRQAAHCFHFTNLRPLEARKNMQKGPRITDPQLRLLL